MASQDGAPSDNLYITGLPADIEAERLKQIFGAYAEIVSTKVLSNPTGQGFCAALCRFGSVQAATWIVQSLNGNIPEGLTSPIQVKFAAPPKWQQDGGKGGAVWGGTGMMGGGFGDGGFGKMGGGKGDRPSPYGKTPAPPSDNLYIIGMPGAITPEQLQQIFSGYGSITQCKLLGAKEGQTAKDGMAAALIRYSSVQEATNVLNMLNGNIPEGLSSAISIRYADQKEPSGGKGGFTPMGKGPGGEAPPSDNLYITGLPEQCGPADLGTLFGAFGTVVSSKVLGVKFGKAAAMVRFASVQEASQVKANMDGQVPPGCQEGIKIQFADSAESKASRKGGKGEGQDAAMMAMFTGGMGAAGGGGGGGCGWSPVGAGGGGYGKDGGSSKGGGGFEDFGGKGGKGKGKGEGDMNAVLKAFESSGGLPGSTDKDNQVPLYVSGLPSNCEDVHLYRLFSPFGPIAASGVRAMMWPDGSCKGFGFVNYLDVLSANAACESINGAVLPNGAVLQVKPKTAKGPAQQWGEDDQDMARQAADFTAMAEMAQLQAAAAQAEYQLMNQGQA
mmetsp:Transcript_55433/g.145962  ORF Transcript_55433/g.145962 Transcript_55433/m.145962 type:complete len:558 (-) Transcript_55433:164-1837(-)